MLAVVLSAINFVVLVTLHARTLICSYMFFFAQVFGTFLRTTGEKSYHSFVTDQTCNVRFYLFYL